MSSLHHRTTHLLRGLRPRHPAQFVVSAFAAAVLASTTLLMLPVSTTGEESAPFLTALFTATSAVCVTGLAVVDTPSYWSGFGEAVILGSVQVGGFGIMTLASLLALVVSRRLGLRVRLLAQAESHLLGLGEVTRVVRGVAVTSLLFESAVAAVLTVRFAVAYDQEPGEAVYHGVFHAVSAFNNAGFALYADNLVGFVADPWVCLPIATAIIAGGLGFPVLFELRRELRTPNRWSLHTKITVVTSALLLVGGTVFLTAFEWGNDRTLGPLSTSGKLLAGFFASVNPRTAGFNSLDYGAMESTSLLTTDVLMFIGGGSGSTAGGIKVTTFMVLFFAILAETRGDSDVSRFGRRIPPATLRLALTVALVGVAIVTSGTLAMLAITGLDLDRVLFEVISASSTVGLSTGITADLPDAGKYLLVALMFAGRLGPVTVAAALALRERGRLFRYPEERPVVG